MADSSFSCKTTLYQPVSHSYGNTKMSSYRNLLNRHGADLNTSLAQCRTSFGLCIYGVTAETLSFQCWAIVCDTGLTLKLHWLACGVCWWGCLFPLSSPSTTFPSLGSSSLSTSPADTLSLPILTPSSLTVPSTLFPAKTDSPPSRYFLYQGVLFDLRSPRSDKTTLPEGLLTISFQ